MRRAVLFLLLALALAACGESAPGGSDAAPPEAGPCDAVTPDCATDDDCPTEERCGSCSACEPDPGVGSCTGTADCAPGSACRSRDEGLTCVRSSCEHHRDCAEGEACDELARSCVAGDCLSLGCPGAQQCRPDDLRCVECFLDRHCGDPLYPACDRAAGSCVECLADGNCAGRAPEVRCGAAQQCVECLDDVDCQGVLSRCAAGSGSCVQCVEDADCPGSRCEADGSCDLGPEDGESCRPDGSCAPGFTCVGEAQLCRARCDPYAPACALGTTCALLGDADGAILFVNGRPAGGCVPDQGGAEPGRFCDEQAPCRADLLCLPEGDGSGRCRRPCEEEGAAELCSVSESCLSLPLGPEGAGLWLCSPPTTFLSPCSIDAECDSGQGCAPRAGGPAGLETRCVFSGGAGGPAAPCSADADCRSGTCLSFDAGSPAYCFGACASDADCGGGGSCDPFNFTLPDGRTAPLDGCHPTCAVDADCGGFGAFVCGIFLDGDTQELFSECTPERGPGSPGEVCTADSQCGTGLCRDDSGPGRPAEDGFCLGTCAADIDCDSPTACREVVFRVSADGEPELFDSLSACWGVECGADSDCPGRTCQPDLDPADPQNRYRLSCNVAWGSGGAGAPCTDPSDCGSSICFPPSIVSSPRPPESCGNGADDDGDRLADCADPACAATAPCLPGGELCGNGADDDADGLTDCADPACSENSACVEVCGNGADDDGDGATDCDDGTCAFTAGCSRQICYGPCRSSADCGEGTICGQQAFLTPAGGSAVLTACLPRF